MKEVIIYTDGACKRNPGPGGWGCFLAFGEHEKEFCGGEEETTNNRMELIAAIKAIEALTDPCRVKLYTDSVYVKKGISEWLPGWRKRGWKKSSGEPVKNADLWQELDQATKVYPHKIEWLWVKGHSGDPGNERADALANQGVEPYL